MAPKTDYKHFLVSVPASYVAHVEINRPQKLNAWFEAMWFEFKTVMDSLSTDPDIRAVVISGVGEKAFTTGLDVEAASKEGILAQQGTDTDTARKATAIKRHVEEFQDCISSVEKCEKPVICILHGYSFGLALDLSTCADIRLCTRDVKLCVKEVDIGIAADIGTLTRLPKIVGSFSWVKEVCMSARIFGADEALRVGLVSQVLDTKKDAVNEGLRLAVLLASKSPVGVQGTKELLNHARDNTVRDSLRYTGVWNSAMIITSDVERAMLSGLKKTKPTFEKL